MTYTSYFAKISKIPKDAVVLSISRFPPKWLPQVKSFLELAPSANLLSGYKAGEVNEDQYRKTFNEYLSQIDPEIIREQLDFEACGQDIYLLCYEAPDKFCHRHLVRDWLNINGIKCEEAKYDN